MIFNENVQLSQSEQTVELISLLNICDSYYHWCCSVYYQRTIDTLGLTLIDKH